MRPKKDFAEKVRSEAKLHPPKKFTEVVGSTLNEEARTWMERRSLRIEELSSAAFTNLVMMSVVSVLALVILSRMFDGVSLLIMAGAFAVLPLLSAASVVQTPHKLALKEEADMLVESPSVIGMMSMSMHISPSLERAVAYASAHGDGALSRRMREISWDSMSDWKGDLSSGLMSLTSTLSDSNRNLKQSIQMLLTAASERSRIGLERLLDKANDLAVQGVREKMDRYVTSLSFPTMVLFAFGVLLPVMLFSIVPLFTMRVLLNSDSEVAPALGFDQVALIMLVLVPFCTFIFAQSTLRKHPLRGGIRMGQDEKGWLLTVIALTSTACIASSFVHLMQPFLTLGVAVAIPSAMIIWKWKARYVESKKDDKVEQEFVLTLFQIGNCMLSGSSLESAVQSSSRTNRSEKFKDFSSQVAHRVRTEGLTMTQAFGSNEILAKTSVLVRNAYITVAESSAIDPQSAGRTAVNLAKYLSELRESERKGRDRMRSVVDMMSYTSMLFAPMVIGVTGSLYNVVSTVTGADGSGTLTMIGGLYAIELCAVVSYFNGGLLGSVSASSIAYDFAKRAPIAVTAFCLTSMIASRGLTSFF